MKSEVHPNDLGEDGGLPGNCDSGDGRSLTFLTGIGDTTVDWIHIKTSRPATENPLSVASLRGVGLRATCLAT
jgi:hypothetical protein